MTLRDILDKGCESEESFLLKIPTSLYLAGIVWIASCVALFLRAGALTWISGFIYIIYDTALILFIAINTDRHAHKQTESSSPVASPVASPKSTPDALSAAREIVPTVAVLITARNEAHVISECLSALYRQIDPPDEILWIDDGSTDQSLVALKNWDRSGGPALKILSKDHSGKAKSMNEGWPTLASEVIITLDADTVLDRVAIGAIRADFAKNPRLALTGGLLNVQSIERPHGLFETFQRFEYMRSFLARDAWASKNALILISGAFAAYRKSVLEEVGGFDPTSRVEDYELTHRIYRQAYSKREPWEVDICLGAAAVTDVPGTLRKFLRQRERWFAGFIETHWKNRDLVGNSKYGNFGRWMLPLKSFDMFQPLFGLTAFVGLLSFGVRYFWLHSMATIPTFVLAALGVKIAADLCFHYYAVYVYHGWRDAKVPGSTWIASTVSTFLEPVSFQLFRHTGALMGWIAVLTGRREW